MTVRGHSVEAWFDDTQAAPFADGDGLAWVAARQRFEPAAGGSGASGTGSPIVRAFPFSFDTASILTGHTVYVPTIGDLLLDAWIEVDTAWDGTTPSGDFGTFATPYGFLGNANGPKDMTVADEADAWDNPGPGLLVEGGAATGGSGSMRDAWISTFGDSTQNIHRGLPAKFTAADPIKVVVSQDGTNVGDDPASTQGAAILYLVTCTPATA